MDLTRAHKCEVIYEDTSSDKASESVKHEIDKLRDPYGNSRKQEGFGKILKPGVSTPHSEELTSSVTETSFDKPNLTPQSVYHDNSASMGSTYAEKAAVNASPEAHLSKLQSIHRKRKQLQRLRRMRRVCHFFFTHVLGLLAIIISVIFLIYGYVFSVYGFLVSGCILLLAAVGFLIQLCFTDRAGPNKFNPNSVAFSIPAEDLQDISVPSIVEPNRTHKPRSRVQSNVVNQDLSTNEPETPQQSNSLQPGLNDLQAKRLSIALARVASNSIYIPRQHESDSSNVLRLARRLTMASSVIGSHHEPGMSGSNWMTGSHIRHGVRRSLAWNATGASRFYDRNYD